MFEQDADSRMEGRRALQLEARHLEHDDIELAVRPPRQGRAEVPADEDVAAGGREHPAHQHGRGALAVGAADAHDRRPDEPAGELELADHLDAGRARRAASAGSGGTPGETTTRSAG